MRVKLKWDGEPQSEGEADVAYLIVTDMETDEQVDFIEIAKPVGLSCWYLTVEQGAYLENPIPLGGNEDEAMKLINEYALGRRELI